MTDRNMTSIEIIDDNEPLPLAELLAYSHIERTHLFELVDAGVVTPIGTAVERWTFVRGDLRRVRAAHRLMSDLDINVGGVALVLELIEERNALLKRLRMDTEPR